MTKVDERLGEIPGILIQIGHRYPGTGKTSDVPLPVGTPVMRVGKPFWHNGEHWSRIDVDGVALTVPDIFLEG